jgi:broad specificity phosphatase PhoE
LHTTVYLIRNAETAWNGERRLPGRRELGLNEAGLANARSLTDRFAGIALDEVLASPLPRAVETAQPLAVAQGLEVARDPRLLDLHAGEWEGRTYDEIAADPRYAALLAGGIDGGLIPGGERLAEVRTRMLASVGQALEDNELGASIAVVSHAGPLWILLSHYLSVAPADHARLRMAPAGVAALRFSAVDAPPALLALDLRGRILDSVDPAR